MSARYTGSGEVPRDYSKTTELEKRFWEMVLPFENEKMRKCLFCGKMKKSQHRGDRYCAKCEIIASRNSGREIYVMGG